MDIDPKLLRYFVAVAEDLHFSKASARLGVTQPALSAAIRRLETVLGVELFTRSTRQVRLTAAGAGLVPFAEEVVAVHERLRLAVDRTRRTVPPLRFGTLGVFDTLTAILGELCAVRPDIADAAQVHDLTSDEQVRALLRNEIDIGVGRVHRLPEGLDARLVRLDPVSAAVPAGSPLAGLPAVPPDRLVVNRPGRAGDQDSWNQFVDVLVERLPGVVVAEAGGGGLPVAEVLLSRARREGLALVHLASFPPFLSDVVVRPIAGEPLSYPWYLVTRTDESDPRVAVVQEVAASTAERRGWLDAASDPGRASFPEELAPETVGSRSGGR